MAQRDNNGGELSSVPRNPLIAAVLHETLFAETKGSGIRTIRDAMDEAGLVPPLFESDREQDQFTALFSFHHFLGEDDIRWLARFKDLHLSNEEARALVMAREIGAIDNASYRNLNKVDTLAASAALGRLRDAGLLSQRGRGSATWYQPTEKLVGESDDQDEGMGDLSSKSGSLSSKSDALSSKSDSLSSKLDKERNALLNELPGQMAARVGGIGQRHPPEQVRELVAELCHLRAWRVEELALLLNRKAETVRQDYLRPLLAEKRIAMTLPDKPNSPQQAYRSVEGEET
ncbi:MAG: hypothetical protein LBE22_02445 [Azoarcus sp.]|jgi:ATP-dependent DNA helicase RecG|nr:hypothetical protein [Azoarcus sp.]